MSDGQSTKVESMKLIKLQHGANNTCNLTGTQLLGSVPHTLRNDDLLFYFSQGSVVGITWSLTTTNINCRIPHSVSHLYTLSVAWCGTSVHKTGRYLYTFIYIIHNVYTQVSSYTSDHLDCSSPSPLFFPAASARVVLWPIDARGWHRR